MAANQDPTGGDMMKFSRTISGRVVSPGHADYDALRKPWLSLVEQHPALIVEADNIGDVVKTILFAQKENFELAIMATGHGIAKASDDGILLHLGKLDLLEIDSIRRTARFGPGVTSGRLLAAAQLHGLTYPSGQAANVGATGFTLGGGIGWMVRKLGPASSAVNSMQVVLADGSVVRASEDEHPDLFWALRGGGGNFGVVVEMEVALAAVPEVYGGEMHFPFDRASEVLRAYRDWCGGLGDDTSSVFRLLSPPLGYLPSVLDRVKSCYIGVCHADPATADAMMAPLKALGEPLKSDLGPRSVHAMAMLDPASSETRSSGFSDAHYLRALNDDAIDRLLASASKHLPPLMQIEIQHLGGAFARSGSDASFEPFGAPTSCIL